MFSKIEKGVFLEDIKMSFMEGFCESIGRQGIACYANTSMSEFGRSWKYWGDMVAPELSHGEASLRS
jgi:hypothetical protein